MPKLIYPKNYKSSSYYYNPKIEVRKSPIHGMGVFAKKSIKKNEVLEEDHYIILKGNFNKLPKLLQEYIFAWTKELPEYKSKAAVLLGTGPIYNSSPKPNADWLTSIKRNRFIFHATRNIKAGEEIMIDYGPEYWESRNKDYRKG